MNWKELVPKRKPILEGLVNNHSNAEEPCTVNELNMLYNSCIDDHQPLYEYVEKLEAEVKNNDIALGVLCTDFEVTRTKVEKLKNTLEEIVKSDHPEFDENPCGQLDFVINIATQSLSDTKEKKDA